MISEIFVSNAFAQAAGSTSDAGGLISFLPLILIFLVFYFLLIRPQQRKYKEHQLLVNNLKIGNKVCTASGIIGVIADIDDKNSLVNLEISKGLTIQILKSSVSEVLGKDKAEKKFAVKKSKK